MHTMVSDPCELRKDVPEYIHTSPLFRPGFTTAFKSRQQNSYVNVSQLILGLFVFLIIKLRSNWQKSQ